MENKERTKKYIKICDIYEYIISACLILNCRSVWVHEYLNADRNNIILLIITTVTCALCMSHYKKIAQVELNHIVFQCIVISVSALAFIIIRPHNITRFIALVFTICLFITFYIIVEKDKNNPSIIYKIADICTLVAFLSFIIWILGSVLHVLHVNSSIVTTWNWTGEPRKINGYFGIQYEIQQVTVPLTKRSIFRNSSFFTEGPMASFVFSYGLLVECLLRKRKRVVSIVVLALGVLSTLSTTGILVTLFCLLYLVIASKQRDKIIKLVRILILPFVIAIVLIVSKSLINQKFNMSVTYSGNVRLDDFIAGFKCWKSNPLVGYGFENNNVIIPYMSAFRSYNHGFSNSLTQILVNGGIFFLVLYFVPAVIGLYKSFKLKQYNVTFFLIFFYVMFVMTLVSYQWISILMLIYSYNLKFSFKMSPKEYE